LIAHFLPCSIAIGYLQKGSRLLQKGARLPQKGARLPQKTARLLLKWQGYRKGRAIEKRARKLQKARLAKG
jgi:hypothetical protein